MDHSERHAHARRTSTDSSWHKGVKALCWFLVRVNAPPLERPVRGQSNSMVSTAPGALPGSGSVAAKIPPVVGSKARDASSGSAIPAAIAMVEDMGTLDVYSLRDHLQNSQKMSNGGKRLTDIFKAMDTDRSGALSKGEFAAALRKFGYSSATDAQVVEVLAVVDADGSGSVQYKEMEKLLRRLGPRQKAEVEEEPPPPPPPPKPVRDRFPKVIGPDTPFAQPTCVQVSALSKWARREQSRPVSPRESCSSASNHDEPSGSLALVLSRRDGRASHRQASLCTPTESGARVMMAHEDERAGRATSRHIFKPSIEQGVFPRQRAREIMLAAGHNGGSGSDHTCHAGCSSGKVSDTGSRSSSPVSRAPRSLKVDHLHEIGPDLAQVGVRQAAVARSEPLEVKHVRERLAQQYASSHRVHLDAGRGGKSG